MDNLVLNTEKDNLTIESKLQSLKKIDSLLNKEYLHDIEKRYGVLNFSDYNKIANAENVGPQYKISYESNVRALQVDRWVFDKEEQSIDKFKNILNVFAGEDTNLALLVKRDNQGVSLYFIIKNETNGKDSKWEISDSNANLLMNAITGNFNGTCLENIDPEKDFISDMEQMVSISCLTNIPSEKSDRFISQGLEKLLDGIRPEKDNEAYYILILAEPLNFTKIQNIQSGYEELASAIFPHLSHQFSIAKNEGKSEGTMESLTNTENIFSAVTKTHGFFVNASANASVLIPIPVGGIPLPLSVGGSVGVGYSYSKSKTEGWGTSKAETTGKNYNLTVGTTENTTYNYQSYAIKELLEKLQKQLERINNGKSLGLWKCASYVLATSPLMAINVANFLKSLTQGDESYIEPPIINTWNKSSENEYFSNIRQYLLNFTHPIFHNDNDYITPTYNVSTTELSDIMVFPRKSVAGLPVLECAAFGREVVTFSGYQGDIRLGIPYHMYKEEHQQSIMLNKNSLASHTFITGSTGSGKSNTVYEILNQLSNNVNRIPFLVIEPAKGEYKNIFGNRTDVSVYGTNPALTLLLRINPFAFPNGNEDASKNIHILEHLDRLIEIFNVCWPMYAAMPAVLKKAIEKSYEKAGWDLSSSKNVYNFAKYPTFADITDNIKTIIDSSEYSDENKGNYKGALITRLESLTNGINGMIFTDDELENETLFDKNVIVDLSRVSSMETKALIMGILIMKLQEYRQTSGKMNADLHHITVLEEAHNLLKRTSTEQSSETANLLGKSVEMLANAIAEMRTYGEGFIIADQSPGLMDMSVIRNTNTKIILRLPDEGDRVLVGKAAGLNDDQIVELAKLQCGVAAIYQNDWIQPVLCKVQEFKNYDKDVPYQEADTEINKKTRLVWDLKQYAKNDKIDNVKLKEKIEAVDIADFRKLGQGFIASLFKNNEEVFNDANNEANREANKTAKTKTEKMRCFKGYLLDHIEPSLSDYQKDHCEHILTCIVSENCKKNGKRWSETSKLWIEFISRKEDSKDGNF